MMRAPKQKIKDEFQPSPAEQQTLAKHDAALRRVCSLARVHGATAADLAAAGAWPLIWLTEIAVRQRLEPLADIGRKVSNSRRKEASTLLNRDARIVFCAVTLLQGGANPRGLAAKIRKKLKPPMSERQLNRVLDRWMPHLLKSS